MYNRDIVPQLCFTCSLRNLTYNPSGLSEFTKGSSDKLPRLLRSHHCENSSRSFGREASGYFKVVEALNISVHSLDDRKRVNYQVNFLLLGTGQILSVTQYAKAGNVGGAV